MDSERVEKILQLQLDWVKVADAKVPSIFAINVVMLGVIAALMKEISSYSNTNSVFSALSLIPLVLSIGFLALAIFPRLSGPKGSNVFFGGITKKAEAAYLEEVKALSEEKYKDDLLSQVYRNAEIAETKYSYIKKAFISSFVSVPFWLVAIYLLYV